MVIKRVREEGTKSSQFPSQKRATSAKGRKFAIDCIEGAENLALFSSHEIRQSYYNKRKNYDLANDIIDPKDVERVCSPMGIDMTSFPATLQNYPLANPKIKLLVGEEMKRPFEWRVRSTNPNTVNTREDAEKARYVEYLSALINDPDKSEEQVQAELQDIQKYFKYSFQDIREKMSSDILSYFMKEQDLVHKFSRGFYDALIAGEEIYRTDVVAGEPVVTKCNPLNVFTYGTGESPYIDDADIIIEDSYISVGAVIDEFYEYLKPEDITELEDRRFNRSSGQNRGTGDTLNYKNFFPTFRTETFLNEPITVSADQSKNRFGGFWDDAGNVRVTRVVWKSRRKVGKLSYFDRFGDLQETIVDENYKPNEELGESIEWLWINEFWEGTRIGKDLYVKIQPRPVQFRKSNNLSHCASGYVGTAYNINASRARSLYDQMKPYQYLYNIFMYRTELAFAKYKGPMIEINAGMIPDHMEIPEWLHYSEVTGYMMMDPFNESKKGTSEGTLAGNMNTVGGKVLSDDSIGNYINANLQMLEYLEQQIGNISGVSEQRQGQIEQRELVGNVERAVSQSAHITEQWFKTHEHVKLRVLETLLETAKYCYRKDTDKRIQYVLDDMSTAVLKIDGQLLAECDYSVFINSGTKDQEFEQALKQLAHAGLQNEKLNFADVIKIYQSNNMTDKAKMIEEAEQRKAQEMQKEAERQREHEQQLAQQQQEMQERLMQMQIENREDEQASKLEEIRIKGEEDRKTLELQMMLQSMQKEGDNQAALQKTYLDAENQRLKIEKDSEIKKEELKSKNQLNKETIAMKKRESDNKIAMERAKAAQERKAKQEEQRKDQQLEEQLKKKEISHKEKMAQLDRKLKEKEAELKEKMMKKEMSIKEKVEMEKLKIEKQKMEQELEQMEKMEQIKLNTEREKSKMKIAEAKAKPKPTPGKSQ